MFKRANKLFVKRANKFAGILICHVCLEREGKYFYAGEKFSPTSPAICQPCLDNLTYVLKHLKSIREYRKAIEAEEKKKKR